MKKKVETLKKTQNLENTLDIKKIKGPLRGRYASILLLRFVDACRPPISSKPHLWCDSISQPTYSWRRFRADEP